MFELLDVPSQFGNITTADGDRRATNCRRERGGNWRKSAQVEKRSGEPAQIAVRYPPRVKGYHLRGQTESRSGRLRGSIEKTEGNLCFFFCPQPTLNSPCNMIFLSKDWKNSLGMFLRGAGNARKRKRPARWTLAC